MVHSKSGKAPKPDVALSFPQLSLHSAAATGNVGLVKYALINGQPQNSSLHGVLPIHAACSNGNEAIVRMLLENGADVNAPRLPRRYSNDKRSHSAPTVGTSGSTPLHFAAANGHAGIVELLLSCGARPDLTEKRGLTPEDVALQSGHPNVAQILRNWDRSVAASSLPVVDGPGRRHSLDVRSLPPPDLASGERLASAHPSLAKKESSASLRASRRYASSNSLQAQRTSVEPTTYSSLTHLPNASSHSLSDGRRGLPAVLEKAAHPRSAIKHALGIPQGGPSTSPRPPPLDLAESTQDSFVKPILARKGSTSSTRSALKGLFGRKRRSSSSSMISSPFSPTALTPMDAAPSLTIDDMPSSSVFTSAATSPELEAGPSGSSSPSQPQFPTIDLPPPIATSPSASRPHSPYNYRPRKSSILSTTDAITVRQEEHSQPEASPALSGTSSHMTESSVEEQSEAQDQIPEIGHYRSPSGSRLRANSAESGSSAGSRLSNFSPHGVPMHSPLGSFSGESTPSLLEVGTRARRSASTSTEPDLRHLVLSGHREGSQTDAASGSPVSSSWSQRGFPSAPSATSTAATSVNYSSTSGTDQMHRKLSSQDVTPSMADALVKQAESRLLAFNSDRSASKPSLSEQLAAYSDTLNLQREVRRREKARQSYTWEKLDKDGHRTPIPPSEGLPAAGSKAGKTPRPSAFQQGVLDVRRDPPPKLRQEAKSLRESRSHSSLTGSTRVETPRPSGSSHRHPTSSLQYRILESNHLNVPAPPSGGRLSPGSSSIDDPVRRVSGSSASSSSSVAEAPRSARPITKRESLPIESVPTPELVTPIASWGAPDTPFGIEGLGGSDGRGKSRLARGLMRFRGGS